MSFLKTGLGLVAAAVVFTCGAAERPNILWLTSEDNNSTFLGCYGNEMAKTPNLDKLAGEGFRYLHCYSNGAVCSASRSSWITGMNAVSVGLQNHRSRYPIPDDVVLYPEALQKAGYYTGNFTKTDYNIAGDARLKTMWDNPKTVEWDVLKKNQPFFQVINHLESHESRAMSTEHIHSTDKVKIPPYHPDLPGIRANYASYYDAVTRMDRDIGHALRQLEEAGLAENTIVIYNSDHGGPLPRGKRFMYDSGTHCPLIVRIPEKYKACWPTETPGSTVDRLVSFIDMPATWLSLAGAKIPSNYQGKVFLGNKVDPEPEYHFSFRGRNDARLENSRAIRDKRFLFVKNFIPYVPHGQYLSYQWKIPIQRLWEEHYRSGKCDAVTGRFFEVKRPEEFFDTQKDPFCINNLIDSPEHKPVIDKMRKTLVDHQKRFYDSGLIPESELNRIANGAGLTLYETIRKPSLYNPDALLDAAEVALQEDAASLKQLVKYTQSPDAGVRYWGANGLFMIQDHAAPAKNSLEKLLNDESHNVRLMAAWTLIDMDGSKKAYDCIEDMIRNDSYAMVEIFNVLDWMGNKNEPLLPTVKAWKGEQRDGSAREMKDYLLNGPAEEGKNKKQKKKAKKS